MHFAAFRCLKVIYREIAHKMCLQVFYWDYFDVMVHNNILEDAFFVICISFV